MEKSGNPPPYTETAPPALGFVPPPRPEATVTQVVVGAVRLDLLQITYLMIIFFVILFTVTQVVVGAVPQAFGPHQQSATCPHCKQQIITRTETQASTKTHIIALVLCLLGCWLCCCIPYCVDSCQNKNHYCPHCNAYLGTFTH
ncbi:LITAF-like zinc ribbon domain [Popillia japonica]|uniref:LITAF-like zinc ribbon domain n=1 Tax=Popillia japonica TaxID=7064 RepID=A0AAW1L797_POPJA